MSRITEQEARATAIRIWALCQAVAKAIYGNMAATPEYAATVARCLFMIAAHESDGWNARRQYEFKRDTTTGAFGLWQCEKGGMGDALKRIRDNPVLFDRVTAFLTAHGNVLPGTVGELLLAIQDEPNDPLACVMTRVYHLAVPAAIPADLTEMAKYCKKFHNRGGAATPEKYLTAFRKWFPE